MKQLLPVATPARTRQAVLEQLEGRRTLLLGAVLVLLLSGISVVLVPPILGRAVDVVSPGT